MKNLFRLLILGFIFCAWLPLAFAQSKNVQSKKKTTINFDDQLVTGELKKPELFYLLQKKQFNFGRLIKLRENFLPEMRKTSEEMQRGGN